MKKKIQSTGFLMFCMLVIVFQSCSLFFLKEKDRPDKLLIVLTIHDKEAHFALNEGWNIQGHAHYQDWLYKSWMGGASKPTTGETQMLKLLKRSGYVEKLKSKINLFDIQFNNHYLVSNYYDDRILSRIIR